MIIDQSNLTLWRIGSVGLTVEQRNFNNDQIAQQPYPIRMMLVKNRLANELTALGYNTAMGITHNNIFHLIDASLSRNKAVIMSQRYPGGNRDHGAYINLYQGTIGNELRTLLCIAVEGIRNPPNDDLRPNAIRTRCREIYWLAICFDPLFTDYVRADFGGTGDDNIIWELYQNFIAELNVLRREHIVELDRAWGNRVRRDPRHFGRPLEDASVDSHHSSSEDSDDQGN
jgi:hypothetical protein